MKKLLKIVLLCVLSLTSNFTIGNVRAFEKPIPKPKLWPGRPGGNGDGSEEYMNGLKYGEMNGPWVYMRTDEGDVYELLNNIRNAGTVTGFALNMIMGALGVGRVVIALDVAAVLQALLPRETSFDDARYYVARSYGSGRKLKVEYELYDYKRTYLRKVVRYLEY